MSLLFLLADPALAPWLREPAVLWSFGSGLGLLLVAACLRRQELGAWYRSRKGGTVSVEELQSLSLGIPPFILDLRSRADFRGPGGFLRGAACIPYLEVHKRLAELDRDPRRSLVVVDETDHLAHRVAPYLRDQGFPSVYVLRGGLRAWRKAGLPVSTYTGGGFGEGTDPGLRQNR